MAGVNEVTLIGHLGQDPELRHTQGGTAIANLSMATSRKWTDKDGNRQEDTQWHRVVVWGKMGENCAQYLSKGRQVYVKGRLQTRDWEDKDGVKRWTTEIVAVDVQFLGTKNEGGGRRQDEPPPIESDEIPF